MEVHALIDSSFLHTNLQKKIHKLYQHLFHFIALPK